MEKGTIDGILGAADANSFYAAHLAESALYGPNTRAEHMLFAVERELARVETEGINSPDYKSRLHQLEMGVLQELARTNPKLYEDHLR